MNSTGTEYGIRAIKASQNRLIDCCINRAGNVVWIAKVGDLSLSASYRVSLSVLGKVFTARYTEDGATYNSTTTNNKTVPMQGVDRTSLPLYLFASCKSDRTPYNTMPWGNLFSASLQEDGVYKRQFYPCVKDGVPGLCDQVENKFYPSIGTANFLATDTNGVAIAEGAFPVETCYAASAAVEGEYKNGFSIIIK